MSSEKPGDASDDAYGLPTPDRNVFGERDETAKTPADETPEAATSELPHPDLPTEQHPFPPPRGRMTFQDASTPKREPTLAEQRARQQAEAEAEAEAERAEHKRRTRRRVLIGGAVVVVAAGVIGSQYLFNASTTANCVGADQGDQGAVVNDQYCDAAYVTSHGGYVHNGIIFLPIGNGGFRQYQYYYGGSVRNGHVSGGSYTPPSGGAIKTGSGKTITRGGFGVPGGSSGGSDSGSHSGGSGGKSGGG
jgi:hypothetical protein